MIRPHPQELYILLSSIIGVDPPSFTSALLVYPECFKASTIEMYLHLHTARQEMNLFFRFMILFTIAIILLHLPSIYFKWSQTIWSYASALQTNELYVFDIQIDNSF